MGVYTFESPNYFSDGNLTLREAIYTLAIMPDSCVFTAMGVQLYYVEKCTVEETKPNTLFVRSYSLIDGHRYDSETNNHLITLLRKGNKYYFVFGEHEQEVERKKM